LAIGEEAKVSDADETSGQYMLDKAAEELRRRQSHFAVLVAVRVVLPPECDALSIKCQKAVIGDGDAMGIATKIPKHSLRPAERRFGVNDPILAKQSAQECCEPSRVSQRFEWAVQAQFMLAIEPAKAGNILASEDAAEDLHRQEERIWAEVGQPVGESSATRRMRLRS